MDGVNRPESRDHRRVLDIEPLAVASHRVPPPDRLLASDDGSDAADHDLDHGNGLAGPASVAGANPKLRARGSKAPRRADGRAVRQLITRVVVVRETTRLLSAGEAAAFRAESVQNPPPSQGRPYGPMSRARARRPRRGGPKPLRDTAEGAAMRERGFVSVAEAVVAVGRTRQGINMWVRADEVRWRTGRSGLRYVELESVVRRRSRVRRRALQKVTGPFFVSLRQHAIIAVAAASSGRPPWAWLAEVLRNEAASSSRQLAAVTVALAPGAVSARPRGRALVSSPSLKGSAPRIRERMTQLERVKVSPDDRARMSAAAASVGMNFSAWARFVALRAAKAILPAPERIRCHPDPPRRRRPDPNGRHQIGIAVRSAELRVPMSREERFAVRRAAMESELAVCCWVRRVLLGEAQRLHRLGQMAVRPQGWPPMRMSASCRSPLYSVALLPDERDTLLNAAFSSGMATFEEWSRVALLDTV